MTDYKQLCAELLHEWDNAPTPSDLVDTDVFGIVRKIRTALKTEETMTTQQHLITPPPELVLAWSGIKPLKDSIRQNWIDIATQAARWGADMELEACCEWVSQFNYDDYSYQERLRAARRRPKPPSLKKQALTELNLTADSEGAELSRAQVELIRRALESLPS